MNQRGENAWTAFAQELQKIYAGEKLTVQWEMRIYYRVFQFCSSRNYYNYSERVLQEFIGEELYYRLKAFITKHVNNLYQQLNRNDQDEKCFEDCINQCAAYKRASRDVDRIFSYLNRHWIRREMDEGNKEVCRVYDLSMNIWKTELFDKIRPSKIICRSVHALIAEENGSAEDKVRIRALIKAVCEILFEYGLMFILQLAYGEADRIDPDECTFTSTAEQENYLKYRKLFMGRLLDETDKRLRGEAPPETVLQTPA